MRADAPKVDPKQAHLVAQWPADRPIVCCRFDAEGPLPFLRARELDHRALQPGRRQEDIILRRARILGILAGVLSRRVTRSIAAAATGRVVSWETAAACPKPIRTIEAHQGWVRAIAVSPDGSCSPPAATTGCPALGILDRETRSRVDRATPAISIPGISSRRQDALERRSPGCDQGMGSRFGPDRSAASTPRPCTPTIAASRSTSAACEAWRSRRRSSLIAAGGLHKATNPLGAVHEPLVLVFDTKTRKLARTLLTDGIAGGVIWRAALPGRRQL